MKNTIPDEKSVEVILEGAASVIDISGTCFNSHRNYTPNQNLRFIWANVGRHFAEATCEYEKSKWKLVEH